VSLSPAAVVRLRVAGLLGAAALLVAVWLGFGRLAGLPAATPVRCITPSEVAAGSPLLLAWEGGGPPFRVTLEDAAGGRLWESGRLTEPLAAVPPAVAGTLPPNQPLRWTVEGVDRRGRTFAAPPCPLTILARG
jgi:hypothetical protein